MPRFDEREALAAIECHSATLFEGVPTMYLRMLGCPDLGSFDLSSLRLCTVGGQTMSVSKMSEVEDRFGCRLLELWGMTELGGIGVTHPHNARSVLGSIGVPLPFLETKVIDIHDADRPIAAGEAGELLIRGPIMMDEYFGNNEATTQAIDADGWLHTGDLVERDQDGYLYVIDRVKEVILSGGYNVYPAEVERVVSEHLAVAMVAVAGMDDELKGQVPKAFVVLRQNAECSAGALVEHCRKRLAPYKVPRAIEFVTDLPKTSTGKILRRLLVGSTRAEGTVEIADTNA
jgi:long-chain acyl-CoA synthetase